MGSPLNRPSRDTCNYRTASPTSSQPPKHYRHFVERIWTLYEPTTRQPIPPTHWTYNTPSNTLWIDSLYVLIHADKTTSVYRKTTHTNLYTHYSSSTPQFSKDSVISSLTRRAHTICSPCHLEPEIQPSKSFYLMALEESTSSWPAP